MKKNSVAIFLGLVFGMGLSLSKMTDPQVVLGFFDLAGNFNPMLLFVFVSALVTTIIGYRLVLCRNKPLIDKQFHLPKLKKIDNPLLVGAVIFGLGWGISGYCPAPVIAVFLINPVEFWIFSLPMLLGFVLFRKIMLQ